MTAGANAIARPLGAQLSVVGACALGLLVARLASRGIHVPGHAALPALFFLVYAAKRVPRTGAAGATALPTIAASLLGFAGDAGGAATLLAIAGVVEAAAFLAPGFATRLVPCLIVGLVAGAARIATQAIPLALGQPDLGAPALASALGYALFGALGAALVPAVDSLRARRRAS